MAHQQTSNLPMPAMADVYSFEVVVHKWLRARLECGDESRVRDFVDGRLKGDLEDRVACSGKIQVADHINVAK